MAPSTFTTQADGGSHSRALTYHANGVLTVGSDNEIESTQPTPTLHIDPTTIEECLEDLSDIGAARAALGEPGSVAWEKLADELEL